MAGRTLLGTAGFAALAAALAMVTAPGAAFAQEVRELPGEITAATGAFPEAAKPMEMPVWSAPEMPQVTRAAPAELAAQADGQGGQGDRGGMDRGGMGDGGGWRGRMGSEAPAQSAPQAPPPAAQHGWGGGDGDWNGGAHSAAPTPSAPPMAQSNPAPGDSGGGWRGNRNWQGGGQDWQGRGGGERRGHSGWNGGEHSSATPPASPPVSQNNPSPAQPNGGQDWQGRGSGEWRGRGGWNGGERRDDASRWNGGTRGGNNDNRWNNDNRRNNDNRWRDGNRRNNDNRWGDNNRWRDNNQWRDNNRWGNDHRRWDRDWRRNNRYNWLSYRSYNRDVYRMGRYYSPYRNHYYNRLSIGIYLDSLFFSNNYRIQDPWQYRLPEVYDPYRWIRYYNDAVLVDIYSGEVVDVIHDFFW